MSSYVDDKTRRVCEASESFSDTENFIRAVADIEDELIHDVTLAVGDREFPSDLRERAMSLIARWHVGMQCGSLAPTDEALEYVTATRTSELVETMHSLFHEVASQRLRTRFGLLSDHPRDIWHRRDEHDEDAREAQRSA
jgi:hypothetical protein